MSDYSSYLYSKYVCNTFDDFIFDEDSIDCYYSLLTDLAYEEPGSDEDRFMAHHKIMEITSFRFLFGLSSSIELCAIYVIRCIERFYGDSGPLAGFKLSYNEPTINNHSYSAAILYCDMVNFGGHKIINIEALNKSVIKHMIENKVCWFDLKAQAELVEKIQGVSILNHMSELAKVLHEYFVTAGDIIFLQNNGGVQRVVSVGGDINKLWKLSLDNANKLSLKYSDFRRVHEFYMMAGNTSSSFGLIPEHEIMDRHSKFMFKILNVIRLKKHKNNKILKSILYELTPFISVNFASKLIPMLTRYLTISQIARQANSPKLIIKHSLFKKSIIKYVDKGYRYDLVVSLGLEDMFSDHELNNFKGSKLESALGL